MQALSGLKGVRSASLDLRRRQESFVLVAAEREGDGVALQDLERAFDEGGYRFRDAAWGVPPPLVGERVKG